MKDFGGRTAVVTGAASGIGRALAEALAREGMSVVLADINARALERTVSELRNEGYEATGVRTDVADPTAVDALAQAAIDAYGRVHVLCNNAGVALSGGLVWEMTPADWEWSFRVNFWGVLNGIRSFVPIMLSQGDEGHIVNTASTAGLTPNLLGIYGVTKHAVVSLTEYLYRNLNDLDSRINVSLLCPGYVQTNIGNSARHRQPEYRNPRGQSPGVDVDLNSRIRSRIQNGQHPGDVAAAVIEGIRSERFWIVTADDDLHLVQRHHDSLIQRTNPGFSTDDI